MLERWLAARAARRQHYYQGSCANGPAWCLLLLFIRDEPVHGSLKVKYGVNSAKPGEKYVVGQRHSSPLSLAFMPLEQLVGPTDDPFTIVGQQTTHLQ
jgi:hypothetical protein